MYLQAAIVKAFGTGEESSYRPKPLSVLEVQLLGCATINSALMHTKDVASKVSKNLSSDMRARAIKSRPSLLGELNIPVTEVVITQRMVILPLVNAQLRKDIKHLHYCLTKLTGVYSEVPSERPAVILGCHNESIKPAEIFIPRDYGLNDMNLLPVDFIDSPDASGRT
jgi:hypothetical protein